LIASLSIEDSAYLDGLPCRFGPTRFYARIYLHRLPREDRDAALALLDEIAAAPARLRCSATKASLI
jgi:hypothetical protein